MITGNIVIKTMKPYYSEMVVELGEAAPKDLQAKLDELADSEDGDTMCWGRLGWTIRRLTI